MLYAHDTGIYRSSLLVEYGFPYHGFTTRHLGDMRKQSTKTALLQRIKFTDRPLVWFKQMHSDTVWIIQPTPNLTHVKEADASIITSVRGHNAKEDYSRPLLTVHTADCAPILLADAKTQTVAVVHAGWKGTLRGITKKVIRKMKKLGSEGADIVASIGPSIGPCCYVVPRARAQAFKRSFPYEKQLRVKNNHWYFDLQYANFRQMRDMGLTEKHIDWHPPCTSCRNDEFFSYRRDTKQMYGEMIAYITL